MVTSRHWTPAARRSLAGGVLAAYTLFALWMVRGSQSDGAITWMEMHEAGDFPTWSSLAAFLYDLRTAIPPVLAAIEVACAWVMGDALFITERVYQVLLAAAFLLPMLFHLRSPLALLGSFALALIFLTSAVAIHPGNPMIYDVYFPVFTLLFIGSLALARARDPGATRRWRWLAAAGFFLSMAELSRPFLLPIVVGAVVGISWPLRHGPRRELAAFLVPLILFSGGWHVHQAVRFGQITWTNQTGFGLLRAWPMVAPGALEPETAPPFAPGRGSNINTQVHADNSRRLIRAVAAFVIDNPETGVKHTIRRIQALVGNVRTNIYSHDPVHPVFALYRPAVWLLASLLLANLIALAVKVARAPRSAGPLLTEPRHLLAGITAYSIVVLAVGDASEEARFLISLLPLLAAAARNPLA